ncbi:MAG: hypothetical protein IPN49_02330 [Saprospiraceae bacterium]|nr:hypothetical protein [Saprospiraceae bacterium]MBK8370146.1 hypothetical protein [Saprospiraceae bacterium]MBK8817970.1 hypothetical protein [Saprospiraceae bacterium]MBK9042858.1 hypothetical protein [Saprospiraceae bacterium]
MESEKMDLVFNIGELLSETMSEQQKYGVVLPINDFTEENEIMLNAIFKAVMVDITNQVKILKIEENQEIRIMDMYAQPGYLFIMGIPPEKIGFTMPLISYQFTKIGRINVLQSDSLMVLKSNVEAKKKLWNSLKSEFLP